MDIAEKTLQLKKDFDDVYEAGKKSQYDEFWDSYQKNGDINQSALYMFAGGGWNINTFKPKYPIRNKYTSGIFQNTTMRIDLVNYCEKNNIILDFSNTETWSYQFGFSEFTRVGVIDTRSGTGGLINVFNGASRLVTIDKLILKDTGGNAFTNTFNNCSKLENITIEGVIGKNISFAQSPLTKESIISVITHLSSTSSGQALSLKASSTNAIDWSNTIINGITYNTFDEICGLRPNWTISLV